MILDDIFTSFRNMKIFGNRTNFVSVRSSKNPFGPASLGEILDCSPVTIFPFRDL